MADHNDNTFNRRNGFLFSCEPCRILKVGCDHASPVCGRCTRRENPEACIYLPAPQTKPRSKSAAASRRLRKPASKQSQSQVAPSVSELVVNSRTLSSTPRPGFLGSTSYAAVYEESNHSWDDNPPEAADDPSPICVHDEHVRQGGRILSLITTLLPLLEKLLTDDLLDIHLGLLPQPAFRVWTDWVLRNPEGIAAQKSHTMEAKSRSIWQNTARPLKYPLSDLLFSLEDWAEMFAGQSLRWEAIGSIFAVAGIVSAEMESADWNELFAEMPDLSIDQRTFTSSMRGGAETCLGFVSECEALNEAQILLLIKTIVVVECIQGDGHHLAWQRSGELCNTLVALGFHRDAKEPVPTWLLQMRKMIFMATYTRDKMNASMFGRPPRICIKYCRVEIPTSSPEDEAYLYGHGPQQIVPISSAKAWSGRVQIHIPPRMRIWFELAQIREDMLEMALSKVDDIADGLRMKDQLCQRMADFRSKHLTNEDLDNCDTIFPFLATHDSKAVHRALAHIHCVKNLVVHIGAVQTEFLITRMLINQGFAESTELVPISQKLLDMVICGPQGRKMLNHSTSDLVYCLVACGIPSAGVLAIELLRQGQMMQPSTSSLPRSETIQKISVFIAILADVDPRRGNYSICMQGCRALRRIMDQILNQPTPAMGQLPLIQESAFVFPSDNDFDFIEWLGNAEWDNEPGQSSIV